MKVLAIDTSFRDGRIGLVDDGTLIADQKLDAGHLESHTFTAILKLGIQPNLSDIDLIALAAGPGSFTGLKIGAVVVKSLSYLQHKPFKGVGTLPWLALSCKGGVVLPVIKSHGDRYYWGLYKIADEPSPQKVPWELISPSCTDAAGITKGVNAMCIKGTISAVTPDDDSECPALPWAATRAGMPLASLASLGEAMFNADGTDDPVTFTPLYISRSQAEEKLGEG